MDPLAAIELLQYYEKHAPPQKSTEKTLAAVSARWIQSMASQGRGSEAVNDPLISNILQTAQLFHNCGWRP
jgi:hypothetical protein